MIKYFIITAAVFIAFSCKQHIELQEEVKEFYGNGNKKIIELYEQVKENKVVRYYKEFYYNKQLKFEGGIKDGKRNGHWIYYYENGNKWSEGNYIDGVAVGKFTQYYEDGKLWMYTFYKNGTKTRAILFDTDGKAIEDNNL
jgi:antitoxin component YwqK of YwqJK toxin-antitoxin module